ncbi:MAG: hypothetical protein IJC15_02710 [Clostridia bacterium]|nr:hypothetical protein [Clostridia bacterium]
MKTGLFRLFLLSMALAMLFLLSACNADVGPDETLPPETTVAPEETEPAPGPLVLAAGGKSEYVIVRPEIADSAVVDAGASLYSAFAQAGIEIGLGVDWEKPGTDPATRPPKEILIGETNRSESAEVRKTLRYDEYAVTVLGERVVICGGGPEATAAACAAFIAEYLPGTNGGELTLSRDISLTHSAEYPVTSLKLAGQDIAAYTIAYTDSKFESAAKKLQSEIVAACGWMLPVESVNRAEGKIILVGKPTDPDMIKPCDGRYVCSYEMLSGPTLQHAIEHKDGMLVLAGQSNWTARDAVVDFAAEYLRGKTGEVDIGEFGRMGSLICENPVYDGADLRVMTLNSYGTNGDYKTRFPYQVDLIKRFLPDVLGMQEVNKTTHSGVVDPLLDIYAIADKWHDGGNIVNYTPILYRKDKYELVGADVFFLRSRYTETNTKSISWAVLSPLDGGQDFIVINLHGSLIMASYNLPGTNAVEGAAWRTDNAREMLELYDSLCDQYGDLPAFFTGDFNCNSDSEAYATAIAGGLSDPEVTATVSRVTGIKTHHGVGEMPAAGKSVDRVFTTEGITAYVHNIVTDADALAATDHCAVYVDAKIGK